MAIATPTPFVSKAQLQCQQNLATYIRQARVVSPVWKQVPGFSWEAAVWATPRGSIRFMKYDVELHARALPTPEQQFDHEFMEFAKAYLINSRRGDPAKAFRGDYLAVQIVWAALMHVDGHADITKLSPLHLAKAVDIIGKRNKSHRNTGLAVRNLVRTVAEHNLSPHSLKHWKPPFEQWGADLSKQPVKTALPDDEALLAFAEIFSRGYHGELDDEAIYITSITAILLSVPMRIAEKLRFRLDTLKSEFDTKGKLQWYLQYYSNKNKKVVLKGIPEVMVEHCREAFSRLERITCEGRRLALHLESGTMEFFPHPGVPAVPADQVLTQEQVMSALGCPTAKSAQIFMRRATGNYRLEGQTLTTLWKIVRDENMRFLPFFPYQVDPNLHRTKPPKMSESLICLRRGQLTDVYRTSPVLLGPTTLHHYSKRVSPSYAKSNGDTHRSFLERHGYPDSSIRSHQLRHFLNTAAREAGVGIEVITKWSGRAAVKQTRDYIHLDPAREARKLAEGMIPLADVTPTPITSAEYDIRDKGPIITTRYGICMHSWTVSPCQKSGDCLNCSELLHCKGHKNSLAAVKVERDHVAENLNATLKEIEAGNRPATRWVETHSRYLERLNSIVAMHENPNIPDGSPVMITGKDFSQAQRILSQEQSAPKKPLLEKTSVVTNFLDEIYDDDLRLCLDEMMGAN